MALNQEIIIVRYFSGGRIKYLQNEEFNTLTANVKMTITLNAIVAGKFL